MPVLEHVDEIERAKEIFDAKYRATTEETEAGFMNIKSPPSAHQTSSTDPPVFSKLQRFILEALENFDPLSVPELYVLVKGSGVMASRKFSIHNVYNAIKPLKLRGFVAEAGYEEGTTGKPVTLNMLTESGRLALASYRQDQEARDMASKYLISHGKSY